MNTFPITHSDGSKDTRYTITREFDGHAKRRFILRFCGEWVDGFGTYGAAVMRAVGHNAVRKGAVIIESVEA